MNGTRYRPRHIIRNAADPAIFKRKPPCALPNSPVRLISTSWSNGLVKGADTLQALSKVIDCSEFNLTFVGTQSRTFPLAQERACVSVVPPKGSEELAEFLITQDIFIAPSRQEPASNSLIEAIAVGLPVAFREEGGHPEAVGVGGVPFTTDAGLLPALREIAANYGTYASAVGAPLHRDIDSIARQYCDALRGYAPGGG